MGQSQLIEIAIGVVFVWFILSVLLSVVNEGLALVFRIRAKHLWLAVGRILRPAESKYARKLWDTLIRLPFKPDQLDRRPVAHPESADPARTEIQARPTNQADGTVDAELQRLYNAAAPMLTDVAAVGRRSKLTDLPANIFSEAIVSLAKRVHPADLVSAATSLDWLAPRVSSLAAAIATMPQDKVLDVAEVSALSIPGVSVSEKEALFTKASASLTPRDLVDYFRDNPKLRVTIMHAMDNATDAAGKVKAGREAIEKWYDREMDRLSAAYRRQNRKVLLVLSIPVVLFFRANTVGTVHDLNHDAALRQTLTNAAVSATANSTLEDAVKNMCAPATTTTTTTPSVTTTTTAQAATTTTTTTTTSGSATTTTIDPFKAAGDRFSCAGTIVQSIERFGFSPPISDLLHPSRWSFKGAWHWVVDDYGLLGRAITLIALMFGAQFWFDALRRLVGIRSKLTNGGSAAG